jgi:hypothetical protein
VPAVSKPACPALKTDYQHNVAAREDTEVKKAVLPSLAKADALSICWNVGECSGELLF